MPYNPPSYAELHESTLALLRAFNSASKRYVPPSYAQLYERIGTMVGKYRQLVAEKPKTFFGVKPEPNPMHIEMIERLCYLAEHLPKSVTEGSPEQIQQHNILLGALFYLYLIIDGRYNGTCTGRFFSYMKLISVNASALYRTINDMLGISEENILDKLSIVTRCSAYLEYLRSIGTRGEDVTPYIPKGFDGFFEGLQAQIAKAEDESRPMEQQMGRLRVVQSFDAILRDTANQVSAGLSLYCPLLSENLKGKKELPREEMITLLSTLKLSPLAFEIINYLLRDDEVLKNEGAAKFLNDMQGRLETYNQFTLLGMYLIMLVNCVKLPLVTETLNIAIGITSASTIDE